MDVLTRVLSIQSHVVSGYVGNKSAVFPMQVLGLDVDFINSVQFSNHTGYKSIKGQVLNEKELAEIMQGLSENNLDTYSHLLTGYIGSSSFLKEVVSVVKCLKDKNPNLIYVCDPVMGDNGKLYVKQDLIPIYQECILPLTTILTPNLFETEILTDIKITNISNIWEAIDKLHSKGCETIVISSAALEEKPDLMIFASSRKKGSEQKLSMEIKKLPINFTGTGDLFASLFLSWMHKTSNNLKDSLEKTVASLQAVLRRTCDSLKGKEITPRNVELKLIQSKQDIEQPNVIYEAKIIEN